MTLEQLKYIASFDDLVRFCGTDTKLVERYQTAFSDSNERVSTFDPIFAAASNSDLLQNKKNDIWSKKGSSAKRGHGMFDEEKFTKLFINKLKAHLESDEPLVLRCGFDGYAYLMAYEEEIMALYSSSSLTKLQKAALHYIEIGKEKVELNYLIYVATYDDLVTQAVSSNVDVKPWKEFIVEYGKQHYEKSGRNEILSGDRPLADFFNAIKYIATYPLAIDSFKNDDGTLDENKGAIAYITFGSSSGYVRSGFDHNIYLANYPELLEADIYVNKDISPVKVAKIWLQRFADGIDLTRFDALDFKDSIGLGESVDIFANYVEAKKNEYLKMMKNRSSLLYKLKSLLCQFNVNKIKNNKLNKAQE